MKDAHGNEIKAGEALERVAEGRGVPKGYMYHVIQSDWHGSGGEDLVADGGFIKELITTDRAKEYKIVEVNKEIT